MPARVLALVIALGAVGCKSRSSEQVVPVAVDAKAMPSNVRAALDALCEAAGSVADPALKPSCSASAAPREGATEEVTLHLRDDEAGAFLYFATTPAYDDAVRRDGGHQDPTMSCAKARIVARLFRAKVATTMDAPALSAVTAACAKLLPLP